MITEYINPSLNRTKPENDTESGIRGFFLTILHTGNSLFTWINLSQSVLTLLKMHKR